MLHLYTWMFVENHRDDGRGSVPGDPGPNRQRSKAENRNMGCFHTEASSWKSKLSHFVNIEMRFCERGEEKTEQTVCVFIKKAGALQPRGVGLCRWRRVPAKTSTKIHQRRCRRWKRRPSGVKLHAPPLRRKFALIGAPKRSMKNRKRKKQKRK